MIYTYQVSTSIDSARVNLDRLTKEIEESSLTPSLERIDSSEDNLVVVFFSSVTVDEKIKLEAIIRNHSGEPLEDITPTLEIDDQGRQIVRRATSQKGWHYTAIAAEVKSSTLGTYNKDYLGNDLNEVVIKLYDINDVEIIEGDLYQHTRPDEDIRVWTLAGIPQLGPNYVKVFANGINLRFMSPDDHIESDGRSSKFMVKTIEGVPHNANQFQFIIRHSAGYKHELMIILELYKT
jgi:hypothetical protein